jgi:haloacetate dehalogenase
VTARRDFLKTTLAASAAALAAGRPAAAQEPGFFPGFERRRIATSGATINVLRGGSGPPLLLLHGFPETHVMWHRIAPRLASRYTVVMPDLRGYGDSSKPPDGENHVNYSKRAMALDQVETMRALGFDRFMVVGHDRGARVTWRLAAEHAAHVTRAAILDIVPLQYAEVTRELATAYFQIFFLIQPAPFPEQLISGSPEAFLRRFVQRAATPETFAEYLRCLRDPATVHAICEDYRAGAGIDLAHFAEDGGRKIACPLLVLWGQAGLIARLYDVLKIWQGFASDVRGQAIPGGHFLPEESPEETLAALIPFLEA